MPDFAPPAGTIQSGCLIQAGIDGGNGGQVDNGIPAGFLPNIGKCNDWPKITRIGEEVDGRIQNAQVRQQLIDDTGGRQRIVQNTGDNDPGKEVGQIGNRLNKLFAEHVAYFVQQDGEDNGH